VIAFERLLNHSPLFSNLSLKMMRMSISLPYPSNLFEATWFLIGFCAGRAGARFDDNIKNSDWFKHLGYWRKKIVGFLLDFTHHFWIGLLLMVYTKNLLSGELYWFGYGLFIDDLPDVPARFAGWFKHLAEKFRSE